MKKRFFLPVLLAALCACNAAVPTPTPTPAPAATPTVEVQPADALTLEEKVGQLFIVRPDALDLSLSQETINDAKADGVTAVTNDVRRALQQYPVGGICQFGKNIESPSQLARFNKELQDASATPLFIAVDEEGGLVARLANNDAFTLPRYASAAAVGASGDPEDARAMGQTIGAYLKEYGFNMDFAPDADVNTNPDNPIIGSRAFSSDAGTAAAMAAAAADGLRQNGILPDPSSTSLATVTPPEDSPHSAGCDLQNAGGACKLRAAALWGGHRPARRHGGAYCRAECDRQQYPGYPLAAAGRNDSERRRYADHHRLAGDGCHRRCLHPRRGRSAGPAGGL